jgi:hypothetical protein
MPKTIEAAVWLEMASGEKLEEQPGSNSTDGVVTSYIDTDYAGELTLKFVLKPPFISRSFNFLRARIKFDDGRIYEQVLHISKDDLVSDKWNNLTYSITDFLVPLRKGNFAYARLGFLPLTPTRSLRAEETVHPSLGLLLVRLECINAELLKNPVVEYMKPVPLTRRRYATACKAQLLTHTTEYNSPI